MKMNTKEAMYKLASVYATSRQISLQEAISFTLPELWQTKCYPKTIFVNTNLPENRIRMCKSKAEIEELEPDSTDVFKRNMVERYIDRPNQTFRKGLYAAVDKLCLATFLAYYYVQYTPTDENDSQPDILTEEISTMHHNLSGLPLILPLMSSNDKLKCRQVKQVLRYHIPNETLKPEEFAHYLLFLFYPFRNENDLKSVNGSYCEKLSESNILEIVNTNRRLFEPDVEEINSAFELFNNISNSSYNTEINLNENDNNPEESYQEPVLFDKPSRTLNVPPSIYSDDDIREMICSLNTQQQTVFDLVYTWAKRKITYQNCTHKKSVEPIRLFISGGAGVGKSYLVNTIFEAVSKVFNFHAGTPDKLKVLKVAPTGVNIDGTTINTALNIPLTNCLTLSNLNDTNRCKLRQQYSELEAVIVDEISMVSNVKLYHIHKRLSEIFNVSLEVPFGGLTVLVVGDLYQLPPVRGQKVFLPSHEELLNLCHPWQHFQFCELTEIMRQQGDNIFIDLLNNARTGVVTDLDIALLNSRAIDRDYVPPDAVYLFAENSLKDIINSSKLSELPDPPIIIYAVDISTTRCMPVQG